MSEKQFYDWQMLGGTEFFLDGVNKFAKESYWQIAKDGDEFVFRCIDLKNLLREKADAFSDINRKQSKRMRDLAEIAELVESHPELWNALPQSMQSKIDRPL